MDQIRQRADRAQRERECHKGPVRQIAFARITRHFLGKWNQQLGREVSGWSDELGRYLEAHSWPGNVRELENSLERGIALARADTIEMDDLLLDSAALSDEVQPGDPASAASSAQNLHDFLESAAEERIRGVLAATADKRVEAARRLGIDRTTLYRLIRKYGIEDAN